MKKKFKDAGLILSFSSFLIKKIVLWARDKHSREKKTVLLKGYVRLAKRWYYRNNFKYWDR